NIPLGVGGVLSSICFTEIIFVWISTGVTYSMSTVYLEPGLRSRITYEVVSLCSKGEVCQSCSRAAKISGLEFFIVKVFNFVEYICITFYSAIYLRITFVALG